MWFVPSKGRPARLRALLHAMAVHGSTAPGVVWCNEDDPSIDEYRAIDLAPGWSFRFCEPGVIGCAEKLRRAFAEFPAEPWYGFIADDIGVETDGFERRLIAAAGTWGIANGNDKARAREDVMQGRLNGASVFGGKLLRALGYWVPEGFEQLYIDDVWETIGRSLSNWQTLMDVITTHDFAPYLDPSKMDATCARVNTEEAYAKGKARFERWATEEAQRDIGRVVRAIATAISPDGTPRREVMLATPVYANVAPQYAGALVETVLLLRQFGIHVAPAMLGGYTVHAARNILADNFMRSPCSDLLFVDADIGWRPWDVVRLMTSQQALIAGVGHKRTPSRSGAADVWCFKPLPLIGPAPVDENGNREVLSVGTGFMMIHRSVFQYMAKARPDLMRNGDNEGEQYWRFFAHGDQNGAELSEDYEFCRRWRAITGKVWVDPGIHLKHFGTFAYEGDITACFPRVSA